MHDLGIVFVDPPPASVLPPGADLTTDEGKMLAMMTGGTALTKYARNEADCSLDGVSERGHFEYYDVAPPFGRYWYPDQYPLDKRLPGAVLTPDGRWHGQRSITDESWCRRVRRWLQKYPDHLVVTFDYHY